MGQVEDKRRSHVRAFELRDAAAMVAILNFIIIILGGIYSYYNFCERITESERRISRMEVTMQAQSIELAVTREKVSKLEYALNKVSR